MARSAGNGPSVPVEGHWVRRTEPANALGPADLEDGDDVLLCEVGSDIQIPATVVRKPRHTPRGWKITLDVGGLVETTGLGVRGLVPLKSRREDEELVHEWNPAYMIRAEEPVPAGE